MRRDDIESQFGNILQNREVDEHTKIEQITKLFSDISPEDKTWLLNREIEGFFRFNGLQYALNEGFAAIAELLLDEGADVNTWFYVPPLSLAARDNNLALIRKLIGKGAEVNPPLNNSLLSPLDMLVIRNASKAYQEISTSVNLLLDTGATAKLGLKNYLDKKMKTDGVEPHSWELSQDGRNKKQGAPDILAPQSLQASL